MRRITAPWIVLALALSGLTAMAQLPMGPRKPPSEDRAKAAIQNVVVVMMENRSFDHFLGWHPTADAEQDFVYEDDAGNELPTYRLTDFQGCGHPDPDHSYLGSREAYNDGRMDGFLKAGDNDEYAIGYYEEEDRPFFNALARNYTTLDRFFASILGPTYPNRLFLHAAQTDRLENTQELTSIPTIWDRLAAKGIAGRYYVSDGSFLALWGVKYLPITRTYDDFLDDAAAGTLPPVAFVEPRFLGEQIGEFCQSDHPYCDVRDGDEFLARTFRAVAAGPQWKKLVFIVIYDEGGGFFDHVAPPRAAAANDVEPDVIGGKTLLGFRVPAVVASPYSRGDRKRPRVVSSVFDHTSVLKLIEWRWDLAPLTPRDASDDVANLLEALDLKKPRTQLPNLPAPAVGTTGPCLP